MQSVSAVGGGWFASFLSFFSFLSLRGWPDGCSRQFVLLHTYSIGSVYPVRVSTVLSRVLELTAEEFRICVSVSSPFFPRLCGSLE